MFVTCLDLEGVLVPEIWIEFSKAVDIPQLARTTRDEPDYDKLMQSRLDILKEHGLGIAEIQEVIATLEPMPGAREFLDKVRDLGQLIIVSDTFSQFAKPLMEKLGMPTIFCNELTVGEDGTITGWHMRCTPSKLTTVRALQSCGFETIAAGDSFNDLQMIQNSKAGFFFRTTDQLKADYPAIPALETYDELYEAIASAAACC
ncbi:bifunctional phosphoserine phosphatase/homoserine phosphotransferase ThrH [Parvibacter caecicola]|uniref:phosphoserine phosphatase n=1 Tax=Parvibacter caecicola TaxID=747645 RepID=A0A7W5D3C7_9ACTN|nr:bifunctional phosphoserine phosphatase/homoserine phosphotransferase ThrH [Parvibacter caecicola]MBB3171415.1 phosphoserine/homoserine phosphotransferase [Parvibacter caecicola]MCR2042236.1 bifunctional phosphoserine phosphatase/homoserine phosphotransferase ThrH [Parvibacter caecicola]RNL11207.1 bifunctional phosphoserine phosphatase/homoserine phosphotransferase ThrH [Parvibacter caecicola]